MKCYFFGGGNPFGTVEMDPPQIWSMFFLVGQKRMWRVADLQYQFVTGNVAPILVNVILVEIDQPPEPAVDADEEI